MSSHNFPCEPTRRGHRFLCGQRKDKVISFTAAAGVVVRFADLKIDLIKFKHEAEPSPAQGAKHNLDVIQGPGEAEFFILFDDRI